ncbi:PAN domain-containing protein At5g03700-like [Asparagus officinalis]|uniref:PAN domain-containing protein At5g03700-like n=1 Tax=Asparagus officinalis TaxID=4686 RepID=UPI00098E1CAB|nr:PAN domain-containing protein At5g03700-like [Asparagus officinalis]
MASKYQLLPSIQQLLLLLFSTTVLTTSSSNNHEILQRGFSATPDPSSSLRFQPILTDPTSTFSFGFLRINSSLLDLSVIHLPSSFPLWRAIPSRPVSWSHSTSLSFNGTTLHLSDTTTTPVPSWSTPTPADVIGDGYKLVLLNSSNLQIAHKDQNQAVPWQSFDYPSDTIVQHQNFTSQSTLSSTNQRFSMSLGPTYLGLYMQHLGVPYRPMYWKRTALQAKAQIVLSQGPIYARLEPTGFLGLYQNETAIVDVISFDTFNAGIKKNLRRLTLEHDGNLKAYYWNGSDWVSDFEAISQICDLPATCGAYSLCHVKEQQCGGCVDNSTDGGCFPADSGDLCGSGGGGFHVVRRAGVDLANKDLIGFQRVESLQECEMLCERNCSCWGAVYNNVSRDCGIAFASYGVWNSRRWRSRGEDEMGMPYKDLKSSSFRSIELANSFRK